MNLEQAKQRILELEQENKILRGNNELSAILLPIDLNLVIRQDQPYNLPEVLKGLVECADVLLHERAYDAIGWEQLEYCYRHGKDIIKLFEPNEI